MEVYSDDDYKAECIRSDLTITSVIMALFQIAYAFFDSQYYATVFCWLAFLSLIFFQSFLYTRFGIEFLRRRVASQAIVMGYFIIGLTMFILSSVIVHSRKVFDPIFYMFIFLIVLFILGILTGLLFSDKAVLFNNSKYVKIRNNEIEIRKIDLFGVLTLKRMPLLRAPLVKFRNFISILALLIGTGGAGIGMGIAEMLKRSDVLDPDISVHAVLFFSLGIPVLFTFGILIYSTMTYLSEWRKLVANIDKEYGEHVIIFNSKKKSYKKIKEIMAESGSNHNG
ncbi:hypothetical protein [Vibrio pectenicida]|uniref:Uncharacterized protein n=1 Tax=Vibrio pectenicida TaxID=62763 RepID=A0A3R9F7T0_9VIBR|nr:hypothetical protein [Vibrio pectenicida]RSD30848.1 hypothetical protein EJA03_11725 [Vibrio pectenicida]